MSGNRLLIDTNIALYLLGGDQTIATLLQGKQICLSFVTQLELLSFKSISQSDDKMIRNFLNECTIIDINSVIKETTILLRREYNVKLPDGIIMATSLFLGVPIITSDAGFKKVSEIDLLYYEK